MKNYVILFALFLSACGDFSLGPTAQDLAPTSTTTPAAPAPPPTAQPEAEAKASEPKPAFALETKSLYLYRNHEIASMTEEQISDRNDTDIAAFESFNPGAYVSDKSGGSITDSAARAVITATYENPIASPYSEKYQRPDVKIGYCFGRATFAHLALKKMGVQTQAIRKVWLVGPMKAGSVNWGFHVATAVYSNGLGWRVLDANIGRTMGPREWFEYYSYMSRDKRLRIYFTPAIRFGVSIPRYDRVDLGLNLSEEADWYHHYFYDLMAWFRKADFPSLGLNKVDVQTVKVPASKTALDDIYSTRESVP
jgi:hypothetical protein